jgi:SpoVK/Ycf46/Vps4 family AAA+-type ATPase
LWDGLLSGQDRILVLGATNRPDDIDAAILRRMPKRFTISLPDQNQRRKILDIVRSSLTLGHPRRFIFRQTLRGTKLASDFSLDDLAAQTVLYSGSDLKELCRNAAMVPVREFIRKHSDDPDAFTKKYVEVFTATSLFCSLD